MPPYIERGKLHAKNKLVKAVNLGRTDEGLLLMGEALHAVEDYFSHSNFVEVCIWNLFSRGEKVGHLVDLMSHTNLGANAPLIGGLLSHDDLEKADDETKKKLIGQPKIVTGTYAKGANDWVSRLELLKSEVEHGQFTVAFVKGAIPYLGIDGEEIGRALGETTGSVIGGAIGTVAGGVSGTISGGVRGSHIGGALGRQLGEDVGGGIGEDVGEGVGGAFGGAFGGISKAIEGKREGEREGAAIGGAIGGAIGEGGGHIAAVDVGLVALALEDALKLMLHFPKIGALMNSLFESAINKLTDSSAKEAAEHKDPVTNTPSQIKGPTHSQIAKDAPDNPLFDISTKLAEEAVDKIGEAMKHAWKAAPVVSGVPANNSGMPAASSGTPVAPTPKSPEEVATNLVDFYVSAPASNTWWEPIVREAK